MYYEANALWIRLHSLVGIHLDAVIQSLETLLKECPSIAENACRSFMQGLMSSTRSSVKEFVAAISGSVTDVDEVDLDFEKLQAHCLVKREETSRVRVLYKEVTKSKIADSLLKRWMRR